MMAFSRSQSHLLRANQRLFSTSFLARANKPSGPWSVSSCLRNYSSLVAGTRSACSPAPLLLQRHTGAVACFSTQSNDDSSSSFGGFSSPLNWWRGRQEQKEAVKYKERIADMAEKDVWTLGDMQQELDEVVTSWMAKMPGISNNKETKMAKQMHKTVTGMIAIVGHDATDQTLLDMSRTDKLKAALQGETSVEEINTLIDQFQTMALMHRILRQRKLSGKPLPTTPDAMQLIVQTSGQGAMSKAQKTKMMQLAQERMKKRRR